MPIDNANRPPMPPPTGTRPMPPQGGAIPLQGGAPMPPPPGGAIPLQGGAPMPPQGGPGFGAPAGDPNAAPAWRAAMDKAMANQSQLPPMPPAPPQGAPMPPQGGQQPQASQERVGGLAGTLKRRRDNLGF